MRNTTASPARPVPTKSGPADAGRATVYAALAADCGIAVTKFGAAAVSGSSAMLAEGIHSTIDSLNQICLLIGMSRGKRPADAAHPFGYGAEVYFWAFIVAVLIFALGSGLSIYEGIRAILHGEDEENGVPWIAYAVLAASFCFEFYSLSVAGREFGRVRKRRSLLRDIRDLKDPSIFVVLAEDSAACVGLFIAAAGLTASWLTGNPVWDASASIGIGLLLGGVALFLALECKGLLIGEGADPDLVDLIRGKVADFPEVLSVNDIRSLHLGPYEILLTLSIDFADDVPSQRIEVIVTETEQRIRMKHPSVRHVFLEVQSRAGHDRMAMIAPR